MSETLTPPAPAADAPAFDFEKLKGRPNLHQTPLGTSGHWSLEKLLSLTQAEALAIWRTLDPPPLAEMNGHYMGLGPDAVDFEHQKSYAARMYDSKSRTGYWLGKAFRPLTETTGEGYNRWRRPGGNVVRNMRMGTRIGPSLVDGRPAFILDYSVFTPGWTLIDELRKLDDFIYFAVAHTETEDGGRTPARFFLLTGPTDEWVGV
jgi:hypothetical protein